jgi:hypothetical protein
MIGLLVNAVMMVMEGSPKLDQAEQLQDRAFLYMFSYTDGMRRTNLNNMGIPLDMVKEKAEPVFEGLERDRKKWEALLHSLDGSHYYDVLTALCPGDLPQPYSAAKILVSSGVGGKKSVITSAASDLPVQSWFDATAARNLFEQWEQGDRQEDATVMAVTALLIDKSDEALRPSGVWGRGIFGNPDVADLFRQYPAHLDMVVEYFVLMHFLTELATDPRDGICQ